MPLRKMGKHRIVHSISQFEVLASYLQSLHNCSQDPAGREGLLGSEFALRFLRSFRGVWSGHRMAEH